MQFIDNTFHIDQLINQIFHLTYRTIDQNQSLKRIPQHGLTQFNKILNSLFSNQYFLIAESNSYISHPDQQPHRAHIQQLINHHIKIDKIQIIYEPNDNITTQSVKNSDDNQIRQQILNFAEQKIAMTKTVIQIPKKRINVNIDGLVKLKEVVEEDQNDQSDLIRRQLYEKRRLLKSILQKRVQKKQVMHKKNRYTFDFQGKLIQVLPRHKNKQLLKLNSSSNIENLIQNQQKDKSIHEIQNLKKISTNNPIIIQKQDLAKNLLYTNNRHRQISHIPLISLKQETKLIQQNLIVEGPKPNGKLSRLDFSNIVQTNSFVHFTQKLKQSQISSPNYENFGKSTKNDESVDLKEKSNRRYSVQRRSNQKQSNNSNKKSYNFDAPKLPSKQIPPIQKYYKYNYDEDKKKYLELEPINKSTRKSSQFQMLHLDTVFLRNKKVLNQ